MSKPPTKTPLDGPLNNEELNSYLEYLGRYTKQASEVGREFEEMLKDTKTENKRIEGWINNKKKSKIAYLLSLIDESHYDVSDSQDQVFLEELRKQKEIDKGRRRGHSSVMGDDRSSVAESSRNGQRWCP